MNNPLENLRDVHLPELPGWWPLAPGWWVLLLVVLLAAGLGYWAWRRYQIAQGSAVKLALSELLDLQSRHTQTHDDKELLIGLSALLRRVAISLYSRPQVAALHGQEWLDWLDRHSVYDKAFSQGAGQVLADAHYRPSLAETHSDDLIEVCRKWIECQEYQNKGSSSRV